MRLVEFRIILPLAVPKYQIGHRYMCAKRIRETRCNGEGIEILENEPFTDGLERGQYTHKVMHFKSKVPAFVRWAIPDTYLHVHEKSRNTFPRFHTVYEMPGKADGFYLVVDSQHVVYDKTAGCPDNLLGLNEEDLAARKVVYLDIVNGKPNPETRDWNMRGFVCRSAGVETALTAPMKLRDENEPPEWVKYYDGPLMVCVKVVKFSFEWTGLQKAVEKMVMNTVFHNILLDSHRALMAWAAEWYNLTLEEDIPDIERELVEEQEEFVFDRAES